MKTVIKKKVEKMKVQERFEPFLAPYEQTKVRSKYAEKPFMELFKDLKGNVNDAILFIMDKYDPLLNSLYVGNKIKIRDYLKSQERGGMESLLPLEDWKNEVYIYLSGAGVTQPFYDKYTVVMDNPTEEYLWKNFSVYLKYSLRDYFYKLIRKQIKQIPQLTLNKPESEGGSEKIVNIPARPDDEIIYKLFEKYLFLLKTYSQKYKRRGRLMYRAIALRTRGVSAKKIAKIAKVTPSAVWKAIAKAKKKWLKFLDAHKITGETPEELPEKLEKEYPHDSPIKE